MFEYPLRCIIATVSQFHIIFIPYDTIFEGSLWNCFLWICGSISGDTEVWHIAYRALTQCRSI
jgi:hypothetical protein